MPTKRTLLTLLRCLGWLFAGTIGGAVIGIVLFILMMLRSDSEAVGQGMFLLIAWMILVPVGASIGLARAAVTWEKRSAVSE